MSKNVKKSRCETNTSSCCLYVVWYSQDWVGCWSHLISLRHQCKVFPMMKESLSRVTAQLIPSERLQISVSDMMSVHVHGPKRKLNIQNLEPHFVVINCMLFFFTKTYQSSQNRHLNLSNQCFDEFSIRFFPWISPRFNRSTLKNPPKNDARCEDRWTRTVPGRAAGRGARLRRQRSACSSGPQQNSAG